jgi:hypothetical protein
VSKAFTNLFTHSYDRFIHGKWNKRLPARCSHGKEPCTLFFSHLPLPARLWHVVVLKPALVPTLSMETFNFTKGFSRCSADGSQSLKDVSGTAYGPFPGTVTLGSQSGIGAGSLPGGAGTHDFAAFYTITSPHFVNTSNAGATGLLQGTLTGSCGNEASSHVVYDAIYSFFGSNKMDGGVVDLLMTHIAGSLTLDMTLRARSGPPLMGSLPPPTPVCPPSGCM